MADDENNGRLISGIYSVAIEPERLEELALLWDQRLGRVLSDPTRWQQLAEHLFDFHIAEASKLLERLSSQHVPVFGALAASMEALPTAAFVVSSSEKVILANTAAAALGVHAPMLLSHITLDTYDARTLSDAVRVVLRDNKDQPLLISVRNALQQRLILAKLTSGVGTFNERHVIVTTTELVVPGALISDVRAAFGLTAAEGETLRHLATGLNVQEIAERSARSQATIRTHVQVVLAKTGARSQIELVRVLLGLMSAQSATATPVASVMTGRPTINEFRSAPTVDGRSIGYVLVGDPNGRPFLWLPKNYGLIRWTASAEKALREKNMCMVAVVRAGYGNASPVRKDVPPLRAAAGDIVRLMSHLGIASCPWITLGDDVIIALHAGEAHPNRITHILACGPTMPVNKPIHYQRMPLWPRFIRANAKFAPQALPFLLRAGFGLMGRVGGHNFMRTVLKSSSGDIAMLERSDVADALALCTEVTAYQGEIAVDAYAAEMIEAQDDWEPLLARCRLPFTAFVGLEDPHIPSATLQEYISKYKWIRQCSFASSGHLAFLEKWSELVAEIEMMLS